MTAFLALLRRDLLVASRNAFPLLMATLTQPILVVLVFGNILPRLGLVADQFRTVMVPGLMSITMLMAGVQGVLMPLVTDLSGSREVDERLLAPLSVMGVAAEKIVAGAIQDAARGRLVGAPTFGKGTIQQWQTLTDDTGGFRLSVARWLTPRKRSIDGQGLIPDVPVDVPADATTDVVLERALELLSGAAP